VWSTRDVTLQGRDDVARARAGRQHDGLGADDALAVTTSAPVRVWRTLVARRPCFRTGAPLADVAASTSARAV
jgi:hypothetical protein